MIKKDFHHLKSNVINLGNYVLEQGKTVDFIKNVGTTLGTKIFVACFSMITTILIARLLGPEGRGMYAAALAIGTMGSYLTLLGLNTANTHFIAQKNELRLNFISNNIFFSLIIGVFSFLITTIIYFFFPKLIFLNSTTLLILAIAWIPISLFNILSQSLLIGIGNIKAFNKIELTAAVAGLSGILIAILLRTIRVEVFFSFTLLGQALGAALALYYLKPIFKNLMGGLSLKLLKENLSYGLKVSYFPSVFLLILLSIDLLLITHYLGEKGAGYYSIATAMANLLILLPGTISILLFAKLSAISEKEKRWAYTAKVIKWLTVLMITLLSASFILAEPIILMLFGQAFQPSIEAFHWLIPAIFFNSIATVYLNYFPAIGKGGITACSTGIVMAINIFLNIKIIPFRGIVGASYVASLSYAILVIILILYNLHINKRSKN